MTKEPELNIGIERFKLMASKFIGQDKTDKILNELRGYIGSEFKELGAIEVVISLAYQRGWMDGRREKLS